MIPCACRSITRQRNHPRCDPSLRARSDSSRLAISVRIITASRVRRGGDEDTHSASGSCSACATRSAAISSAIAVVADDNDFGRAGEHVDGAIEGDQFFGCCHVTIAGTDDLIDARILSRCLCERGDGLRSADAVKLGYAEQARGGQRFRAGLGETTTMRSDACDLRGDDGHQQRWRAADSGRRERSSPRNRLGERAVRVECPARCATSARGFCQRANWRMFVAAASVPLANSRDLRLARRSFISSL